MSEILTAAQMRAIEQAAIASGEVTGLELMERAGRGVVAAMLDWQPRLAAAPHRAVVLCGPGNNGGDGFVVARLLRERGWAVQVFLYGEVAKLPPDAAENARRWREMGRVHAVTCEAIRDSAHGAEPADLVIDALFGTGLTRPLELVDEMRELNKLYATVDDFGMGRIVSVDIPSGLCADSGRPLVTERTTGKPWATVQAALTVTFHARKLGHLLAEGPQRCGRVACVSIGLDGRDRSVEASDAMRGQFVRETDASSPGLLKDSGHKYDHGHALILSGGAGKGGAARLAARGALRIGAGLVTVGCPPAAQLENAARLDAVMLSALDGVEALEREIGARKVNAVCIGPGFGSGARLRAFVAGCLGDGDDPDPPGVVLDADALSEYEEEPGTLFAMLHARCVLTPHQGEFGRLFPDLLEKLKQPAKTGPAYSKVEAAREAAARAGCTVLFKGADTVIAAPDGRCAINSAHYDGAAPWLATAGSGDVLAGFVTGLLARGFDPMAAASTAAWLHVEGARAFGPGLIAEDLPEMLPAVLRRLEHTPHE